jgi:hypothetical protein
LAGGQALAGGCAADVLFNGVDFGDPAQALGSDLGSVAVEDFLKLAPGSLRRACAQQYATVMGSPPLRDGFVSRL